jgi:DNA-binding LytR/AlgR family response regulator
MKILIVDDERLSRSELKFLIKEENSNIEIFEADSVESALSILKNVELDGVFIDMQLPDGIGLDIGRFIDEGLENKIPVVFATAFDQYAIDAFSVNAVDYVVKPFRKEEVMRALNRIIKVQPKVMVPMCPTDKLTVSTHEKVVVLNIKDISFITAFDKHSIVNTIKGEYTTHLSLDKLEEKLQNCGFMRVQRSYIVNLNMINEFVPWFNNTYGMKLIGFSQRVIPISRNKVAQLKSIFEF